MKVIVPAQHKELIERHGMFYVYNADIPGGIEATLFTPEEMLLLSPVWRSVGRLHGMIDGLKFSKTISNSDAELIYKELEIILNTVRKI